jgi:hypothetical protein
MKKNILFVAIISAMAFLASCGNSSNDKTAQDSIIIDSILNMKPDWTNIKRLKQVMNKDYEAATFKQNRMTCPLRDVATGKNYYFLWTDMSNDSIFQHSDFSATWTIKAKTEEGDSMLVDYSLGWQKPSTMSDTTKADFYISGLTYRRINKEDRYFFVKKGKFWEKIVVKNKNM